MDWASIGLVLAGSAGPLVIAVISARAARQAEAARWSRDDTTKTRELHARFIGACTQIVADWSDFAQLPPQTTAEAREMDERRDAHYAELNTVAAMVRLAASPSLGAAAEQVLGAVRRAQQVAREVAGAPTAGDAWTAVEQEFASTRAHFVETARKGP